MADTRRTKAELQVIFADGQDIDEISEQDMRDFVVSTAAPHGMMHRNAAAATTTAVAGTYLKIAGTTTLGVDPHEFDMPADNRLRYIGASPVHMHFNATITFVTAANNKDVGFKFYHYDDSAASGAVIDATVARRTVTAAGDLRGVGIHGGMVMDTNDYIEIWGTNETDTTNFTAEELFTNVLGIFQ